MNLMGKISTSPRNMIDITRMDLLSLGEGVSSEKLEKNDIFLTYKGVIRYS